MKKLSEDCTDYCVNVSEDNCGLKWNILGSNWQGNKDHY